MPYTQKMNGNKAVIECQNKTLAELFIDAGHALFEYIADGSKIKGDTRQEIVLQADSVKELFVQWIQELMARVEQMGMLYADFEVFSIQQAGKDMVLTGAVYGEPIDTERHHLTTHANLDAKSVACKEQKDLATCSFILTAQ